MEQEEPAHGMTANERAEPAALRILVRSAFKRIAMIGKGGDAFVAEVIAESFSGLGRRDPSDTPTMHARVVRAREALEQLTLGLQQP